MFVRWIELGASIDTGGDPTYGYQLDDLKPTLTISAPRPGVNAQPVTRLRFAFTDANSGIVLNTLSVKANFAVNSRPPEAELADLAQNIGDGQYGITLSSSLAQVQNRHLRVSIRDGQGNITRVNQRFSVTASADGLYLDGFEQ